ncbi:MAG TPA: single-stranded DNA-binding protein [Microscillaceae bacterium]|jgi:single-strand DNA-binding protein|nr:single-stranded DNA-binding protein [Microscillaceae bacterium]
MASFNKITLIGHLGNDPDVREVNGKKVANFSLATTEKRGNGEEKTEWFRVAFWERTAEIVEKYLKKGSQVFVEGRLSTREYTDKEGKSRTSLEVLGQSLTLLGSASGGSGGGSSYNSGSTASSSFVADTGAQGDDDLPF